VPTAPENPENPENADASTSSSSTESTEPSGSAAASQALALPTAPDPLADPLTAPLADLLADPLTGPWTPDPDTTDWAAPLSWTPEPEAAVQPESSEEKGDTEHPIPTPEPYPGLYLGAEAESGQESGQAPEPSKDPEPDLPASSNTLVSDEPEQPPGHTVDLEQVRAGIQAGLEDAEAIAASLALAADRIALNDLGVPAEWTTNLQTGDRFMAVVQMLGAMPEPTIPDDVQVIAVVGAADVVGLEAARTALDLPHNGGPRPVVTIPVEVGPDRLEALDQGAATRPVVVSIPVDGDRAADAEKVREILQHVQAEAVIAVLDGTRSLEENRRWVTDLGQVDAVALDGALDSGAPAAVLQLGVPVVRLDGIGVDRVGWAAVLCTQLAVGGATS
jgi:hypothetical protein